MIRVRVFKSFDEENAAEYRRRGRMTPEERLAELAIVQKRAWGEDWAARPIVKKATWEKVAW